MQAIEHVKNNPKKYNTKTPTGFHYEVHCKEGRIAVALTFSEAIRQHDEHEDQCPNFYHLHIRRITHGKPFYEVIRL